MTAEPLPAALRNAPFSIQQAEVVGLSPSRLRAKDLTSPFSGVRVSVAPSSVLDLARAYGPKLRDGEFFSHVTAALLHGMWLPLRLERELVLDVSVRKPLRAPRDRRVRGHHLVDRPGLVWKTHGLPVANPWEAWAQLAWILTEDELIVAGEALLAKGRPRVRLMLERLAGVFQDPARHFHSKLVRAAARLRIGSRSAADTRFRLFLVANGLPEPQMNVRILDAEGRFVAESDLVYSEERVLIEYEGDGHRERKQFRKDITRVERLQDERWHVIRVTEDDARDEPRETIARIGRALQRGRRTS